MFDVVNTSESLPLVSLLAPVSPLTPVDVDAVSYSSALLLPAQFDPCITADPEYQRALEAGFMDFLELFCELLDDEDEDESEQLPLTWDDVKHEIIENVFDTRKVFAPDFSMTVLAWDSGFMLGWLSALALIDRPLALRGLKLLLVFVNQVQKFIA
jgi:hypothetical protein